MHRRCIFRGTGRYVLRVFYILYAAAAGSVLLVVPRPPFFRPPFFPTFDSRRCCLYGGSCCLPKHTDNSTSCYGTMFRERVNQSIAVCFIPCGRFVCTHHPPSLLPFFRVKQPIKITLFSVQVATVLLLLLYCCVPVVATEADMKTFRTQLLLCSSHTYQRQHKNTRTHESPPYSKCLFRDKIVDFSAMKHCCP